MGLVIRTHGVTRIPKEEPLCRAEARTLAILGEVEIVPIKSISFKSWSIKVILSIITTTFMGILSIRAVAVMWLRVITNRLTIR